MKIQKRFIFLIIFLAAGLLSLSYHLNILNLKKIHCKYSFLFKRKTICHFDHIELRDIANKDKRYIRETILKMEPHIKKKQGIDLIFALRDFAHRKIRLLKSQHRNFFKISSSKNFKQILTNPNYGHYCAGIALKIS